MITRLFSDIRSFKAVEFRGGLNVLLSDVGRKSTQGRTRNSAGKSSLVEIVHFLLGADVRKNSLFKAEEIIGHWFAGDFLIHGKSVRVRRHCSDAGRVWIEEESARRLHLFAERDPETGNLFIGLEEWRDFLGAAWFELPRVRKGTDFEQNWAPTFRSLIGYFIRRSKDLGFSHFERYSC